MNKFFLYLSTVTKHVTQIAEYCGLESQHSVSISFNNTDWIVIIITCYLSTPLLIMNNSQRCEQCHLYKLLHTHPSHLTRPHPHAVRRKVTIFSNCRLVPYWRELLGNQLVSNSEFGLSFCKHMSAWGERLTDWATETDGAWTGLYPPNNYVIFSGLI